MRALHHNSSFITIFTNKSQYLIWDAITGTILPFLPNSQYALHGWNFKVTPIIYIKFNISFSNINIGLFLTLINYKPFSNKTYFLHRLIYRFRTYKGNLTDIGPTYMITTPCPLVRLKWIHTNTWRVTIIIGKLNQRQMNISISFEVNHRRLQHIFQRLDSTIHLDISLRIKGYTKLDTSTKTIWERNLKWGSELGTRIRDNR